MGAAIDVSIVIPTRNEARHLRRLISSVRLHIASELQFEIVVADNHSVDETRRVAADCGADAIVSVHGNVSAVRNAGAYVASGRALAFLDADCEVTADWGRELACVIRAIDDGQVDLTGDWVDVPSHCSWLEKFWFRPLRHVPHNHINSANCIISTRAFHALGGFDSRLVTGEDADLSERAKQSSLIVSHNSQLRAIHHGYPNTLLKFLKREMWHGVGDYASWTSFIGSRIAVAAWLYVLCFIAGVVVLVIGGKALLPAGLALLLSSLSLCASASFLRYRQVGLCIVAINTVIFAFYFFGRFLALAPALAYRWRRATVAA